MDREYDLFESVPDGSALWRHTITGHEAIKGLRELSAQTANEVRLMHLPSNTLIAAMTGFEQFSLIPVGSIELALRHETIVRRFTPAFVLLELKTLPIVPKERKNFRKYKLGSRVENQSGGL